MKKAIYWIIGLVILGGVVYGVYYFYNWQKVKSAASRLLANPMTRSELEARAQRNKTTLQTEADNMARKIA